MSCESLLRSSAGRYPAPQRLAADEASCVSDGVDGGALSHGHVLSYSCVIPLSDLCSTIAGLTMVDQLNADSSTPRTARSTRSSSAPWEFATINEGCANSGC